MAEDKSISLWHTWGTIPNSHYQIRQVAVFLGSVIWLIATLYQTNTYALIPLGLDFFALFVITVIAWGHRTVALKTGTTMVFAGGALMGLAWLVNAKLAEASGAHSPILEPIVEELIKISPLLILLVRGRKFTTWTYGATDWLFLGFAIGTGFALSEDAWRLHFAAAGVSLSQIPLLSASVTVQGVMLPSHAIWTGLAAGTMGISFFLWRRLRLAWVIGIVGLVVATADHMAVDYALAHPELAVPANYLSAITIVLFAACVAAVSLVDRWVLATTLPKAAEFAIPKGKKNKDFWTFVLERRKLAYAYYKCTRAGERLSKDGSLVVAILMKELINFHIRKEEKTTVESVPPPVDMSQAQTRADPLPLLQTSWDQEGKELDLPDRFHILSLISEGGMGAIYKAQHTMTGAKIAIKVLHPHLARDPHNVKRFEVEARATSNLNHANLVAVYDYGTTPKQIPFLVMELIEGTSLSQEIKAHGPMAINRLLTIFSQAADALGHAHKRGVIHRDIKPSNMILTATDDGNDFIRIVDFGIAKITSLDGMATQELTRTGDIVGSPMYMSPEQCMGEPLDARSDIYSLGCVAYEALTGQPPFLGSNAVQTIFKHMNEMPPRPRDVLPDQGIPAELEGILFRTLQKDAAQRYQSMEELRTDLEYVRKVWTGQCLENLWSGEASPQ